MSPYTMHTLVLSGTVFILALLAVANVFYGWWQDFKTWKENQ